MQDAVLVDLRQHEADIDALFDGAEDAHRQRQERVDALSKEIAAEIRLSCLSPRFDQFINWSRDNDRCWLMLVSMATAMTGYEPDMEWYQAIQARTIYHSLAKHIEDFAREQADDEVPNA